METEQINKEETTYLSCAETAKLIRKALKEKFPKEKFSVRSSVYAGGASIDVGWTDGVAYEGVNDLIKQFAGAGFDGMIDYKFYKDHWILPDGSVVLARSEGSSCTGGYNPSVKNEKPHQDAKKVSFGADYVFANRTISEEVMEKVAKTIAKKYEIEFVSMDSYPNDNFLSQQNNNWYGIARNVVWKKDLTNFKGIKSNDTESGQLPDFWDVKEK